MTGTEFPQPQRNLDSLNRLNMAEGNDVIKNRYAYDAVQQRINTYVTRFNTTVNQMGAARAHQTITAPGSTYRGVDDLRSRIQAPLTSQDLVNRNYRLVHPSYPSYSFELQNGQVMGRDPARPERGLVAITPEAARGIQVVDAQGQPIADAFARLSLAGSEWSQVNAAPGTAAMLRVFWNVEQLERHYNGVETIIAQLESAAGISANNSLQAQLRTEALARLNAQMNAAENANRLQTIHVDAYSNPFTAREERSYHLLRVPQAVNASFVRVGPGNTRTPEPVDITEISVSGGNKYLRISPEFASRPQAEFANIRLQIGNRLATIQKSPDGLNNLIFNFEAVQSEPPPRQEEQRPPQPERPPERPEMRVGQSISMYTARDGTIDFARTGNADCSIIVGDGDFENRTRWDPTTGARECFYPSNADRRVRINIAANGVITANAMGTAPATVPVIYRHFRPGVAVPDEVQRQIEVKTVDVTPASMRFSGEQVRNNAVSSFRMRGAQDNSERGSEATVLLAPAMTDIALGATVETPEFRIVRTADGLVNVTALAATASPARLIFVHGNQSITREIIAEAPRIEPEIDVSPDIMLDQDEQGQFMISPANNLRLDLLQQMGESTRVTVGNASVEIPADGTPVTVGNIQFIRNALNPAIVSVLNNGAEADVNVRFTFGLERSLPQQIDRTIRVFQLLAPFQQGVVSPNVPPGMPPQGNVPPPNPQPDILPPNPGNQDNSQDNGGFQPGANNAPPNQNFAPQGPQVVPEPVTPPQPEVQPEPQPEQEQEVQPVSFQLDEDHAAPDQVTPQPTPAPNAAPTGAPAPEPTSGIPENQPARADIGSWVERGAEAISRIASMFRTSGRANEATQNPEVTEGATLRQNDQLLSTNLNRLTVFMPGQVAGTEIRLGTETRLPNGLTIAADGRLSSVPIGALGALSLQRQNGTRFEVHVA